ncbi:Rne/Rng family ribonuclease [Pyxidicoccus fallax]|uniref:Rne/Rng family ribonuclease n=1 Tax=Pyxidicoccus fallax TaxID=394095 RepID=A0A848LQX2_9BACT|nr:Rne/Rng family ribonuclease [Pyxidicoccus fallax]NMO20308.1 Rne/Rng family ribonuclease [Pyxidicoccus fallax]NPC83393.1 Rne/Rng family ribonuclease [Pyxidicoccus fallax]
MSSILVINAAGRETRVALVEGGHIAEFYLERKKDKGVVGNIYKGRVVRVLPGMQAAFVDIGLEKAAFLYVSDVVYDPDFARAQFELTEGEHEDAPDVPSELEADAAEAAAHTGTPGAEAEAEELAGEAAAHATESLPRDTIMELAANAPAVPIPEAAPAPVEAAPAEVSATASTEAPAADAGLPVEATIVEVTEVMEVTEATPVPVGDSAPAAAAPGETTEALVPPSETADAALALAMLPPEPPPHAATALGEIIPAPGAESAPAPAARPAEVSGERRTPREAREAREPRAREGREKDREKDKGRRPQEEKRREKRDDEKEKVKQRRTDKIEDLLKVGQEVVVQISKDPIGTKGARLTSHISIPGRHLVFMPTVDHVGISRRISNEKERRRLREIVDKMRPPGTGFIVRTVAENVPQEKLESDIRFLIEVWNQVVRRNEKRGGPGLLHPDLDLILRATRDLFAHDVEKLVVDDREEYERILGFVTAQDPALRDRVALHEGDDTVFDAYGIEQELQRATQRKVWLKSGGYLIIDQAEALTAIDVNSGRYVGKKSLEETITKINVEAAKEIVYQLRLRNIGGIIICDFIDMEKAQNRDKVFKALQEALGRDKAKTNVLRISELGLVEMTRKRVRESIGRVLHEDCPYCDGNGFVKTATTVAYEIFREIRREAPGYKDSTLVINCNAEVARLLQGEERNELRHLMDRYNKSIQVKAQQNYHREQYDIYGRSATGPEHKVASSPGSGDGELAMQQRKPDSNGGGYGRQDQGRRGGRDRDRGERGERGERGGDRRDDRRDGRRPDRGGDRPRGDRGGERGGGEQRGERGERGGGEQRGERGGGEQRGERGGGEQRERGERGDRGGERGNRGERGERRGGESRGERGDRGERGGGGGGEQGSAGGEGGGGSTPPAPPASSGGGSEPSGGGTT